jgi:hypothetical protein
MMMTTRAEARTMTTMDCMVSCAFEQISARYLQISADIGRYLHRFLVTPVDICSHVKISHIGTTINCR